jgi:2-oxoglutarate ferredoxin oxidoreductase subunit beta
MVYGLTKGQASPTSQPGFTTPVQVDGVISAPVNPLAIAIAQDASFVARAFAGDVEKTKDIVTAALSHRGYALVDIFQPCVTYNKVNTYKWFKDNTYYLEASHDPSDRVAAFSKAIETEKLPLGIVYQHEKETFEAQLPVYEKSDEPLFSRNVDLSKLEKMVNERR